MAKFNPADANKFLLQAASKGDTKTVEAMVKICEADPNTSNSKDETAWQVRKTFCLTRKVFACIVLCV